MTISPGSAYLGDTINLFANVSARDGAILNGGSVNFFINNTLIKSVSVVNGTASCTYVVDKSAGNYTVRAAYSGYDKYESSQNIKNLLVMLTPTSINCKVNLISGSEANVTITLTPGTVSGDVIVVVNNKTYDAMVVNGTGYVIVNYTQGTNNLSLTYVGDEYYGPSVFNTTFNGVIDTIIKAQDVNMSYRDGDGFKLTLTDNNGHGIGGQLVFITINGKTYNRTTDINGKAKLNINLLPGTYNIIAKYNGKEFYNSSTFNGTVTVNYYHLDLVTVDLVIFYKDGSQFIAVAVNELGEAVIGEKITFHINGVDYTRTSDKYGEAKLNINLKAGEYNITTIWRNNTNKNTIIINEWNTSLLNLNVSKLVKNYRDNTKPFEAKVYYDGVAVGEGFKVKFTINGKEYIRSTNNEGIAKLNINLAARNYTITTDLSPIGQKVSEVSNISVNKVNTTLCTNTTSVVQGGRFVATLVGANGSTLPNQGGILIRVNGVDYPRTTNSEGQVKLNINLCPGEYKVVTAFVGNGNCYESELTTTLTVTSKI